MTDIKTVGLSPVTHELKEKGITNKRLLPTETIVTIPVEKLNINKIPKGIPATIQISAEDKKIFDNVISEPRKQKELTRLALEKANGQSLEKLLISTTVIKPEKLNQVLKSATTQDFIQTKKVVKDLQPFAKESGGEISKTLSISNVNKIMIKNSAKEIVKAGVIGIPLDAAFNIFDYNSGKTDAKGYVAKSLNGFASWSAFEMGLIGSTTIASAIIGKKLGPMNRAIIGVGTGMIASSLYHKTLGHTVEEKLTKIIPQKPAETFANGVNKYFGKPINNNIITPIKNNPVISMGIASGIATGLTIKYPVGFGKNFLLGMIGATAVGVAGNAGLGLFFEKKPENPVFKKDTSGTNNEKLTSIELKEAFEIEARYKNNPSLVTDDEALKYMNVLEKFEKLPKEEQTKIVQEL